MNEGTKVFAVTRPNLAGRLIMEGYTARETVNPYKTDFRAWEFRLDDRAAKIIRDYYKEIGKKAPWVIEHWKFQTESNVQTESVEERDRNV